LGLYEIHRRVADTDAGKEQLEFEKSIAMMDAYGGMYLSLNKGQEFSRMSVAVCCVISYEDE
jgi:hypothetical protein